MIPTKQCPHKERTSMKVEAKTADDSRVEPVHLVHPTHLNGAIRLFGGIFMQWIDEMAGIIAKRRSMRNVTTASVDNLAFRKGVYQGDMVDMGWFRLHGGLRRHLCGKPVPPPGANQQHPRLLSQIEAA